jgi:hypothetical protein
MISRKVCVWVWFAAGAYLILVGTLTLVAPALLARWLSQGQDPPCYVWIRYIGPMALAFGAGFCFASSQPTKNRLLAKSFLIFATIQAIFDVLAVANRQFSPILLVDFFVLISLMIAIVLTVGVPMSNVSASPRDGFRRRPIHLQSNLLLMAAYLFVGGSCALLLPVTMNRVLRYSLPSSCVAWVQFTGPLALGLAAAFYMARREPSENVRAIAPLAITGCLIELVLDVVVLWASSFKFWPVFADVLLVGLFVTSLLSSRSYIFGSINAA